MRTVAAMAAVLLMLLVLLLFIVPASFINTRSSSIGYGQ